MHLCKHLRLRDMSGTIEIQMQYICVFNEILTRSSNIVINTHSSRFKTTEGEPCHCRPYLHVLLVNIVTDIVRTVLREAPSVDV